MATKIRSEVSMNNEYWIERHRYYELKHFCLQYPIWKDALLSLDGLERKPFDLAPSKTNKTTDPTEKMVETRMYFSERIKMVEEAASKTDPELAYCILKGVTEGLSYEKLQARYGVPCCKDSYYKLYRKFFWILSGIRL